MSDDKFTTCSCGCNKELPPYPHIEVFSRILTINCALAVGYKPVHWFYPAFATPAGNASSAAGLYAVLQRPRHLCKVIPGHVPSAHGYCDDIS